MIIIIVSMIVISIIIIIIIIIIMSIIIISSSIISIIVIIMIIIIIMITILLLLLLLITITITITLTILAGFRTGSGQAWFSQTKRRQTCHFRKCATSVPAEGPACGPDFARHCEFPLQTLQAPQILPEITMEIYFMANRVTSVTTPFVRTRPEAISLLLYYIYLASPSRGVRRKICYICDQLSTCGICQKSGMGSCRFVFCSRLAKQES